MPDFLPSGQYVSWRNETEQNPQTQFQFREEQSPTPGREHRALDDQEVKTLESNGCSADDWSQVHVSAEFDPRLVVRTRFTGLIRIGRLAGGHLSHRATTLPVGIRDSHLNHCDIGDDCVIDQVRLLHATLCGDRCLMLDVGQIQASKKPLFGVGLETGLDLVDMERHWIDLGQEMGSRAVLPFADIRPSDAALWLRNRKDPEFLKRLVALTDSSEPDPDGRYNVLRNDVVIRCCRILQDVRIGDNADIKGANKLKNLTIRSHRDSPTQIGEGVEMVNGIMGIGSRCFYGSKAVRFVLGDNSQLKYGARLIHAFLSDNSTVSCCEVLNSFAGPSHEQHHNDSFLIAADIGGQSNIAAGATLGSNHNGRTNDGELHSGRGFWAGLCSTLKHPSRFACYTLLVQGSYSKEIDQPFPFALVSRDDNGLRIRPAWWWTHNAWALIRNGWKFAARDRRTHPRQPIVHSPFAPDSIDEIVRAMQLIRENLESSAEDNNDPSVLINAGTVENSDQPVRIERPRSALNAYQEMLDYYVGLALLDYIETFDDIEAVFDVLDNLKSKGGWQNLGGQLIQAGDLQTLCEDVVSGKLDSWSEIHRRLDDLQQRFVMDQAGHAWQLARNALPNLSPKERVVQCLKLCHSAASKLESLVESSRGRDFENQFRNRIQESNGNLGELKDDGFVKQSKQQTQDLSQRIKKLTDRLNQVS